MIAKFLSFLLGSGLMVVAYLLFNRFKPGLKMRNESIQELEQLILASKANENRVNSLSNRGLERALALKTEARINFILGFCLNIVVIAITYLIPAITLMNDIVDAALPGLDVQIITALLASFAGLLGAINAFANFSIRSKELDNKAKYIMSVLWKYVSFVDGFDENEPHKSAGKAIEHIEEALKEEITPLDSGVAEEAEGDIKGKLEKLDK